MSEHAYLLTIAIVFLLMALGNLLQLIVAPSLAAPAWAILLAVLIMGLLSYEGFHFARKLGPKR